MTKFTPHREYRGFQSGQLLPFSINPTNWCSCGVWSLHHAMVALGQGTTDGYLKSLHDNLLDLTGLPLPVIGKNFGGMLIKPLCKIVKKAGFKPESEGFTSRRPLRQFLNHHLDEGHPVILGSDPAVHWICVIGRDGNEGYVTADSGDWPTVNCFDQDSQLNWTGIDDGYEVECIAVIPGVGMPKSRSVVPYVKFIWERWESDSEYAANWSNLLDDMLDVFWDAELAHGGMPVEYFFDAHAPQIIEAVSQMNDVSRNTTERILNDYRYVADFHSLVVAEGHLAESISRMAIVLLAKLNEEI